MFLQYFEYKDFKDIYAVRCVIVKEITKEGNDMSKKNKANLNDRKKMIQEEVVVKKTDDKVRKDAVKKVNDVSELTAVRMAEEAEEEEVVAKTPLEKFFAASDVFGDLFILNLAFILACLPIITIGDAIASLYGVCFKMIKKKESGAWHLFWQEFKDNFWDATKVWLVLLFIYGLVVVENYIFQTAEGSLSNIMLFAQVIGLFFILVEVPFLFPLVGRYKNTTGSYLRNAFILFVTHINVWLFIAFPWFVFIILYMLKQTFFLQIVVLFFLIIVAVFAYASSIKILPLFSQLEENEAEKINQNR